MATKFNTIAAAINAAAAAVRDGQAARTRYLAAIDGLQPHIAGMSRDQVRDAITAPIAKVYGVGYKDGQRGLAFEQGDGFASAMKLRTDALRYLFGNVSESASKAPAVQRFDKQRVATIQGALAGLTKAQAKAYLDKALADLSFE